MSPLHLYLSQLNRVQIERIHFRLIQHMKPHTHTHVRIITPCENGY